MIHRILNGPSEESKTSIQGALLLFLASLFSVPAPAFCQQDDFRTWHDATGKFSIEAKFISETDGVINLEKPDGTTMTIPREKLSATDKKFLSGEGENDAPAPPVASSGEVSTADARFLEVDKTSGWSLVPQAVATPVASTDETIEFPWWDESANEHLQKMNFVRAAVVRHPLSPTWLMYAPGGVGGPIRSGFYDGMAFDMVNNKSVGKFTGAPLSPLDNALDSQGTQMLCVDQDRFSRDYSVNLFQLDGRKIRQRAVLYLGRDVFMEFSRDHPWVQFADSDHYLVSASQFGNVITGCCSVTKGSLEWMIEHGKGHSPYVTPDGQTMIVHVDDGLAAIDIGTGDQKGWIGTGQTSRGTISLSPDRTKLIEAEYNVISVYDYATGALLTSFSVYSEGSNPTFDDAPLEIDWINRNRLALIKRSKFKDHVTVVDIDLQTTICNYRFPPQSLCSVDMSGRLRYLAIDPPKLVWQSMTLPHAEIEQEIEANLGDLVKLDRSVSVSMDAEWVSGLHTYFVLEREEGQKNRPRYKHIENADLSADVIQIMTEKFRQSGFNVSSSGQATLTTRTSKSNPGDDVPAPIQPPIGRDIVFGQGARGGTGSGRLLDTGSSRPTMEQPRYTTVTRIPDEAIITGSGYSIRSGFSPLEYEGLPMWIPGINYKVSKMKRDDSMEQGYQFLPGREIVLRMIEGVTVPQVFIRPRNLPFFEMTDDGIKRISDPVDPEDE